MAIEKPEDIFLSMLENPYFEEDSNLAYCYAIHTAICALSKNPVATYNLLGLLINAQENTAPKRKD